MDRESPHTWDDVANRGTRALLQALTFWGFAQVQNVKKKLTTASQFRNVPCALAPGGQRTRASAKTPVLHLSILRRTTQRFSQVQYGGLCRDSCALAPGGQRTRDVPKLRRCCEFFFDVLHLCKAPKRQSLQSGYLGSCSDAKQSKTLYFHLHGQHTEIPLE